MLTIRAMSDGKGYSSKHLEHSDYYAEGERVLGQWRGQGAELLGLSGEVKTKEFEFLRQSCHPETGEFLRQRQSSDRTSADGTTQSKGRNLYDFTISAPKSVSIMATLGGDRRLLQAHEEAVNEALHDLETNAAARIRRGGIQDDRITGNLVIAVYPHDSSRELDPQIHTHAVAANLTYDGTEGRWKALQASGMYANSGTKLKIIVTPKDGIVVLRSGAFLKSYWINTVSAAGSAMKPLSDSLQQMDASRPTMK
jgi:conjugative relaxase-like TrwC/TraI family protein